MKGIVFPKVAEVEVKQVDEPDLKEPTDAMVRVTTAGVCGSDLHFLDAEGVNPDATIGHEFVGVVEAVGPGVRGIKVGERYVAGMFVPCGVCEACLRGNQSRCMASESFGLPFESFGTIKPLGGGQAERVRVPRADIALAAVPDSLSDEDALPVSDILAAAWSALRAAGAEGGENVVILGAGPVGQLGVMVAEFLGANQVFCIDLLEDRLAQASALGARPVVASASNAEEIKAATGGRGADIVVEAVGNEPALKAAFDLVRDGGDVVIVGPPAGDTFSISPADLFVRGIRVTPVLANPYRWRDRLIGLIASKRLEPGRVITEGMPLGEAPEAYRRFIDKEVTKVVLKP